MLISILAAMAVLCLVLVLAPPWVRVLLLILTSALPFSFFSGPGWPDILVIEWLAPLMAPILLAEVLSGGGRKLLPKGTGWVAAGLIALLVSCAVNLGRTYDTSIENPRAYYDILVGVLVFVEVAWWGVPLIADERMMRRVMAILAVVAATLIVARLATYYLELSIPGLVGTFRYEVTEGTELSGASRIGGLSECVGLGVASLTALWLKGSWSRVGIALGAILVAGAVFSGGRAATAGAMAAATVAVAAIVRHQRVLALLIAGMVLLVGVTALFAAGESAESQLTRVTALEGGIAEQSPDRWEAMRLQMEQFVRQPVFGKGVGVAVAGGSSLFVIESVTYGGHGSYTSMLGNFGLLGGVFLATFVFGVGLVALWRILVCDPSGARWLPGAHMCLVFVAVALTMKAIQYVVGGNGYGDLELYCLGGLFVAGSARA